MVCKALIINSEFIFNLIFFFTVKSFSPTDLLKPMSLFDIRTFKTAKVPKNIEMNEMSFESFRNGHDEFELTVIQEF